MDDDLPIRRFLRAGLESAGYRLAEAERGADALREAATRAPDVVLLDLGLPDSSGMAGLERVRAAAPTRPVVVISADERAQTVHDALDRGAAGFIPKTADSQAFCAALRRVLDGRVALPPQLAPPLAAPDADAQPGLSPRQCEVLRLLIEGRSNKDIQRELALSESTVKTHLQAVFRRLDVNTRTQAVVAAARLGLRFGGYRG